jgi:hypothetical protein
LTRPPPLIPVDVRNTPPPVFLNNPPPLILPVQIPSQQVNQRAPPFQAMPPPIGPYNRPPPIRRPLMPGLPRNQSSPRYSFPPSQPDQAESSVFKTLINAIGTPREETSNFRPYQPPSQGPRRRP